MRCKLKKKSIIFLQIFGIPCQISNQNQIIYERYLPKEKLEQLFKKYDQVKSDAKRKFGGTGLGLGVSQDLVERMGGKIWLESEEGIGATFLFTIPKV